MNLTYWIAVSFLLAIAFLIIIPPLWKKREIKELDSEHRNVNIAQDRALELKQQLKAGSLSQQQFDEQYEELELSLGDDLDSEQLNRNKGSQGRWIVSVIVVCMPILSVMTYYTLGEPNALKKALWQQEEQTQQTQLGANPTRKQINEMVNGLAQRLKQEPNNVQGWVMLGRSYKYLKRIDLAVDAFEKAYALVDDDPDLMLDYADALVMAQGGKFSGKATELIFKALEQVPNSVSGLWLAGMAKAEIGETAEAMQYWRQLEAILAPGSKALRELQNLMSSVQADKSSAPPVVEESTLASAISVKVQVTMDAGIKAKVSPDDIVFIYAKALTGPPMPLAIVRKKVSDLPLSVTLDDTMAMMPTMKLSNFKKVKILARISKSGNARQQKGDFVGSLDLDKLVINTSISIVISDEIK